MGADGQAADKNPTKQKDNVAAPKKGGGWKSNNDAKAKSDAKPKSGANTEAGQKK